MKRDHGFVLVNALILVVAMSAVVVFLLSRSENQRLRLRAGQDAARLTLALDAFEALAITRLDADLFSAHPGVDSLDDDWAAPISDLPLDGLSLSGELIDMQGRFNLNLLALPEATEARAVFDRLLRRVGASPQSGTLIVDFLSPTGPKDRSVYAMRVPASRPVGGPILMLDQLADIPGLPVRDLERLAAVITAYPDQGRINVNTASAEVLSAALPQVAPASLDRALRARRRSPFETVDAFFDALGGVGAARDGATSPEDTDGSDNANQDPGVSDPPSALGADAFTVSSIWFQADIRVVMQDERGLRSMARTTVLRRGARTEGAEVAWRITAAP